ncbi:MAG: HlyD family efflux transporter periplasmic adaptor subunit [Acidobacteria bacterium]|nr:MAG: HlyD family efflux transporter periplasmic adaptor subunit [Acidobacteriota bacterium]
MAMDVKRDPAILRRKKMRQIAYGVVGVVLVAVATFYVTRLKPAAPLVDSEPWKGTVTVGDFVRDVRGAGTLVPEDIRWIPARTSGRVDKIVLRPGAQVNPGSVILRLASPELQQQLRTAELTWKSGLAQLENAKSTLKQTQINQEAAVKNAEQDFNYAQANLDANEELAKQNLISTIVLKQYRTQLEQARTRFEVAKSQLKNTMDTLASQIAPQEATVAQQRAQYELVQQQADELNVRAGMSGILQVVPVEEGQQVGAGTQLARVANPTSLKATLRISETQTKDLAFGQQAEIDTRNGKVKGHVTRIDPAAQGGTVGVDVSLDGPLPPGARPDLSVDGTITIERLSNIVQVGRPSFGQENGTVGMFKLTADGREAVKVTVKLGRTSVNQVEVIEGLKPGDIVILSDMSQYDAFDRVRLK